MLDARRRAGILVHQDRPVRFLLAQFLRRTGLCRPLRIRLDGYELRFSPSALAAALWVNPRDRSSDLSFLSSYLKEGDTYIDAGANIGSTVVPASKLVGTRGMVIAFEPHPGTFRFLLENLRLNRCQNVTAHQQALGERAGSTNFADLHTDDENRVIADPQGIEVPMARLDDHTAGIERVALLKLDVEGYERQVLGGATETMAKTRCVYFEADRRLCARYGYDTNEVLDLLRISGFTIMRRDGERSTAVMRPGESCETAPKNLIAVRDIAEFACRTGWNSIHDRTARTR